MNGRSQFLDTWVVFLWEMCSIRGHQVARGHEGHAWERRSGWWDHLQQIRLLVRACFIHMILLWNVIVCSVVSFRIFSAMVSYLLYHGFVSSLPWLRIFSAIVLRCNNNEAAKVKAIDAGETKIQELCGMKKYSSANPVYQVRVVLVIKYLEFQSTWEVVFYIECCWRSVYWNIWTTYWINSNAVFRQVDII